MDNIVEHCWFIEFWSINMKEWLPAHSDLMSFQNAVATLQLWHKNNYFGMSFGTQYRLCHSESDNVIPMELLI